MSEIISITELTIMTPSGKRLISESSFELCPGEVVLLLGPNGAGKSTLLQLLAGLLDFRNGWRGSGRLRMGQTSYALNSLPPAMGGYIFQDFALFDELNARGQLEIARDHSGAVRDDCVDVVDFLIKEIAQSTDIHVCSGGQRQRLAIARTLFSGHPLLLFDEPNSGLDVNLTRNLGRMIRDVARSSNRACLVAAHHFEHLLPVVDRVFLINPKEECIEQLSGDQGQLVERLIDVSQDSERKKPLEISDSRIVSNDHRRRSRPHVYWFVRYFLHYFAALVYSPSVLVYGSVGGVLVGFVSTWLLVNSYPYREILEPILHDGTVRLLGEAQFRFVVPLLIAVLLAARNSAIISADIGHRVYSSQILAMKNLSVPYRRYLLVNVALNMVIACGLYFALGFLLCATASMYTWNYIHPSESTEFWKSLYYMEIAKLFDPDWIDLIWIAAKMISSGLGIALVAAYFGLQRKNSVLEMNTAISRSIVTSTLLVLIIHSLVTIIEI